MSRELVPGAYDDLITAALARLVEASRGTSTIQDEPLEDADAQVYLVRHLTRIAARLLGAVRGEDKAGRAGTANLLARKLLAEVQQAESLFDDGEPEVALPPRRLVSVRRSDPLINPAPLEHPETPLSQSALLINAPDEPSLGSELCRELASADHVDIICAFLKWSGLSFVRDRLAEVVQRGGRIRVLTTTYIGASDLRAIDALIEIGAQVRISYDTRRTRLHAKAWLFHRETGAHTAYIGSSNLSHPALHDGLEWNVRLSQQDAAPLLEKFRAAFESYWSSSEFIPYDPTRDRVTLGQALERARGGGSVTPITPFDLEPHPFQRSILEALRVERQHGHTRNLVVAPTGTGKTLVAAFDYARLRSELGTSRLLFVAHRDRILEQSRAIFRQVLKDGAFGELLAGGDRPERGDHVFATIQSLSRIPTADLPADRFDVVIVDEFHHAEAPTYERILAHIKPRVLLGLTATPERHDGRDVRRWFDGRLAYEMRLWEALEQGLLCPFQYFGINDDVDLSAVTWSRSGYAQAELERLYTGNDARVRLLLAELQRRIADPTRMRALGFCVTIEHARYMADRFRQAGLASEAVVSETPTDEREQAVQALRRGDLQALFTVDLFNEGVDIPEVDTVLFLRPTESATVFIQQLGRGLRLHETKPCLTVLDFIGNARREFRFDRRFRALLGGSTRQIEKHIEGDFPYLPPGCAMHLDPVARARVLQNIRQGIGAGKRWLTEELRGLGPKTRLADFLREADLELTELYAGHRSFTSLYADAFGTAAPSEPERDLLARLATLIHVNDEERLQALRGLATPVPPRPVEEMGLRVRRLLFMFAATLGGCLDWAQLPQALQTVHSTSALRGELEQFVEVLDDARRQATIPWTDQARIRPAPLHVHGLYRQEEVLVALGVNRKGHLPRLQSGVFFVEEENLDLLFVTLRKTEMTFSPTTMYRDYAISPTRFHWESQNTAHAGTPAGKRYVEQSSTVLLFLREQQKQANGLAEPFLFAGPARMVEWSGARPMQIIWELEHPLPASTYHRATLAAG